ncbi:uncharacterized protein At1g08160-like [Macadamia integrifolia]|uniref:uncharacterized protein At1g08160-like n=1 Tax=Macadamia integrifolia TaxID=60698 RepID=UPI001C4F4A4F|nr:uncharacterized protein At1g08160-like [Macadamia integrifolia]
MANPPRSNTNTDPARRLRLIKCIGIVILAFIVLVGIAVLAAWLVIRPRRLVYTIEDGSVHEYGLHYKHLNASFNFVFRAYNPNHKVSVYYDFMQVSVFYDDEPIAFDIVEPFYQPRHNVTRLEVKPVARSAPLLESATKDLRLERTAGEMELTVKVKARIRIKVGSWKSSERILRVTCYPVDVHFSSTKSFVRTKCVSHV